MFGFSALMESQIHHPDPDAPFETWGINFYPLWLFFLCWFLWFLSCRKNLRRKYDAKIPYTSILNLNLYLIWMVLALNLFFMISFLKAVSNLHQNITLEMVIEAMIKVVVANVLYLNILNIMTTIFSISSAMAKEVFTIDAPDLKVEDMDIGSALFYQLFGLLFILAAIVCSFLMLWTVYSRYIKLYLLMILAPFAMSALVGGQEIERSFYAWMRTFLLNAFEIVVIALTMVISFKLIGAGISLFDGKNIVTSMVDGFWDALNSLFTMILVTAAVKGSNAFLSKAMGL